MPVLTCPRCQRVNPREAAFCHFDGAELRPAQGAADGPRRLPHAFVFPSGRSCPTLDTLAHACQEEWDVARDLLRRGVFTQFLTAAGRLDLAGAAQQAQSNADPDVGLDAFLGALPVARGLGPRLDLQPRRVSLGTLRAGESVPLKVSISNQGKGYLHGTLAIGDGCPWLLLGDGSTGTSCRLKVVHEQDVELRIDTRGLPAPQTYTGKLTVLTNGGVVEVPVRFDLASNPFARAPFQGAATPREMAERMRAQPKAAVPLLESGEIAHWFAANGWTYPVQGPAARGVAAVQQFFEGMGLSRPPPIQIDETELRLTCVYKEKRAGQVTLRTGAKKWVYAQVTSDVPWLTVSEGNVSGPQQVAVPFEIDPQGLNSRKTHEAKLKIVANAGQEFTVLVRVGIFRPEKPRRRRWFNPFFLTVLSALALRLLIGLVGDVHARVLSAPAGTTPAPGSFAFWQASPLADPDTAARFVKHWLLATWWLGSLPGAVVLARRGGHWADIPCGLIAGAVAGALGSATLACVIPGIDTVPRLAWAYLGKSLNLAEAAGPPWAWTTAWILFAALWWAALGALLGYLVGKRE